MSEGIPSLKAICQKEVLHFVEESGYNARLINDIARRLTLLEHLLEPLLAALVRRNAVTDVALLAFLNPSRQALDISGLSGIRNSTLKLIGYNCSNLITFDASNCNQMSNSIVRSVLQGCALLETMCLNGCPRISDAAFDPMHCPFDLLKAADTLQTISLKGCRQITGSFAVVLQKVYHSLTSINLSQCKHIVPSCVNDLVMHGTIENLDLSFVECIGDEAFPLHDVSNSAIMSAMASRYLPIHELSLCQSRITDASLEYLSKTLRHITALKLQWCGGITDAGIELLVENCKGIKLLDLQSCNITDRSMIAISTGCGALEELDVSWCVGVTNTGIDALTGPTSVGKLDHFKVLKTTWCSQITDESVVRLTVLPALRVFESFSYSISAECRQKLEQGGVEVRTAIDTRHS